MTDKCKCLRCKREFTPSGWGVEKWCENCKAEMDDAQWRDEEDES